MQWLQILVQLKMENLGHLQVDWQRRSSSSIGFIRQRMIKVFMEQQDTSELERTSHILPKFSWIVLNLDIRSMYLQFLIKFKNFYIFVKFRTVNISLFFGFLSNMSVIPLPISVFHTLFSFLVQSWVIVENFLPLLQTLWMFFIENTRSVWNGFWFQKIFGQWFVWGYWTCDNIELKRSSTESTCWFGLKSILFLYQLMYLWMLHQW